MVTSSFDRTARLWDAATGKELKIFKGHDASVLTAKFSPDGKRVLTTSSGLVYNLNYFPLPDGSGWTGGGGAGSQHEATIARLWNVNSGEQIAEFHNLARVRSWHSWGRSYHTSRAHAAFSPDGKRVVTGGAQTNNHALWDTTTGRKLATLRGHVHEVNSINFSPDGTRFVTASSDNTARVWEAANGKQMALLKGHEDTIFSAVFSPDGRRIVTASADKTARLWDAATGRGLAVLPGHDGKVFSASFSPDGSQVVTASEDGTAQILERQSPRRISRGAQRSCARHQLT